MRQRLALFKLLSFDVTGTLVHLRYSPGTIYERVAREYGYGLSRPELDRGFKVHFKALSKEYPNYGHAIGMHWSTWWSLLVQRTFKDASADIHPEHVKVISAKLIDLYETDECWAAADQAVDFVERIKALDIRSCIITNSDPRITAVLRNLGFPEFDLVLSAFDTGLMKPDPKVFQLASELTSVAPHQAMHIGNDAALDYEAANKCAWTGVLINDDDLAVEDPATYKFRSLTSFTEHLKRPQ